MTLLRRACQDPALPPQSDMAPNYLDLESLILQNCRAFVGSSEADFDVLTRIDPSDQWHAFVLKTDGGKRTKILENKASRPERALELLHEASARMVDQYVTCHGYDLPPGATSKPSTGMRGGLVKPDVIACGSSDSEAFASDSDDSVLPPRRSQRRSHRSGRGASEPTNTRTDRVQVHSGSDSDEPTSRRRTPPWGMSLPRPAGMPTRSISPTPQWGQWGHPMPAPGPVPAPVPAPIPGVRPSMVPPPPSRAIAIPTHTMGGKTYPARLNINWPGNGKRNMLVNVSPTVSCLQSVAANEANMRPSGFTAASSPPYLSIPGRPYSGNAPLRAIVRRVTLGEDDTYEMTAFGNDLTALFRSTSSIPKFEIELIATNIIPAFPPMPPPRPASVASSRSSVDIAD
ncbi:hypothetical protein F53441_449 [Fusarium austroafricanum]|uniref:Uncharacterized protein n=1 Tax=Fusarium austroafricanum TaxID=2364996 RepID=A0A8H4KWQ8_9HYPO|nr:hypothetical protein F53441_449 [Fusarium austroafricanum]